MHMAFLIERPYLNFAKPGYSLTSMGGCAFLESNQQQRHSPPDRPRCASWGSCMTRHGQHFVSTWLGMSTCVKHHGNRPDHTVKPGIYDQPLGQRKAVENTRWSFNTGPHQGKSRTCPRKSRNSMSISPHHETKLILLTLEKKTIFLRNR